MPNGRRQYVEEQKRLPGADIQEIERQESLRQGYARGTEPVPPQRNVGGFTSEPDISKEERRKRKIARGEPLSQEDL